MKLTAFDRFENEIELLLPFYVTGGLSLRDVQRIEAALREDPSLRAKFALVREERAAVVLQNEELGEPVIGATRRLLTELAAQPCPERQSIARRICRRVRQIIDLCLSRRSIGALAGVTMIAQAAVIAALVAKPQPMLLAAPWRLQFSLENHGACVAVVAFSPNAKLTDIAQLLDREKAVIIDGPKPGGLYILRLNLEPGHADCDATLSRLRAEKGVVGFLARTA